MILGVYWYFQFPEDLYQFKYFQFYPGYGGHIDNLAELKATVEVQNPDSVITKLEKLVSEFSTAFLYIGMNENQLLISINDYHLFDCYFQMATDIEKVLITENAISVDTKNPFLKKTERILRNNRDGKFETIQHKFIQIVGSEFEKNNAENLSVRIDCNLPLTNKNIFIESVKNRCKEEHLDVFYYHYTEFGNHCNLILFFTNGRQTKNSIQFVNINSFGSKIRKLSQEYAVHFGHFGGFENYPLQGPVIELMTDEEYILKQEIKKS